MRLDDVVLGDALVESVDLAGIVRLEDLECDFQEVQDFDGGFV